MYRQLFQIITSFIYLNINRSGSSICRACPPGALCGGTVITPCPRGTFESSNQCAPCPAGTYAATMAQTACLSCPLGSSSPPAATSCTRCEPGRYAPSPGKCVRCPAGTYASSASVCAQCSPGSYQPKRGSTQCIGCFKGSYSTGVAAASVYECVGRFPPRPTAGCPVGTHGSNCTQCAPGTYSPFIAAAACLKCPFGTFSTAMGAVTRATCAPCPHGGFAAEGSGEACIANPGPVFCTRKTL
jgi:hypothetical protein